MTILDRIKSAEASREEAFRNNSISGVSYWDGYIDALRVGSGEVATEIFEAIRVEIHLALESNYACKRELLGEDKPYIKNLNLLHLVDGKIAALRGIDDFLNELEEKRDEQR